MRRVFLVVCLLAAPAAAREIRLPLTVEPAVIQAALVREIFNDAEKRAVFWGEPGECSYFYLRDPKVEGQVGRLRVLSAGSARLGTELGSGCLSPIAWDGFLELFEQPRLDGWRLRFEIVESNLYDVRHQKSLLIGQLWDRIKESVQPSFGAVTIDLGGPFRDLKEFLMTVVEPGHADEARRTLDSLRPVAVSALPKGIVVEAALQVPDVTSAPLAAATEAPLTDLEIEAFTARANQWDAFLTFVVKNLGSMTLDRATKQALLETLIEARYRIAETLAAAPRSEDPVRQLFLKSWERLRPVADDIARGLPGAEAVQVLTFLAAGDALQFLDQMGPNFGIEVSADGFRRMARMIAPNAAGDPLDYDPDIDPTLRSFLGFGSAPSGEELPPTTLPPPPMPTVAPTLTPPTPTSRWLSPGASLVARLFGARDATAAEVDRSRDWKGWVAEDEKDLHAYLKRAHQLLGHAAAKVAKQEKLSSSDEPLFRKLFVATAWQESCWRQFERRAGVVTYLRSRSGSVGMLQVNERVWRGFYEVEKLRWKVPYNIEAGAEVLLQYFSMASPGRGGKAPPPQQVMARAVYAAYNGGPEQMRRYLDPKRRGPALTRVIDKLFGGKFDSVGEGVETRVATCLTGGAAG